MSVSLRDFKNMLRGAFAHPEAPKDTCINCGERFDRTNTFTAAGWKETEISQLCELCFDAITKENE